MKKKLVTLIAAAGLALTLAGSISTADAYCWRGPYGGIHCNGYGYYHRYGGYNGYRHCRTWVGPYGGWHRRCWY